MILYISDLRSNLGLPSLTFDGGGGREDKGARDSLFHFNKSESGEGRKKKWPLAAFSFL